ncbi:MAG: PC4/YdbC family ssDNA-binding protein [Anaerovoracaceae bacterium]
MINKEITKHIGVIGTKGAWNLEVNMVKWNNGEEKLDIRSWDSNREKCSKGISLSNEEAAALKKILNDE